MASVISKTNISFGASSAASAVASGVRAHNGIGIARLSIDVDVSPKIDAVVGGLISMIGRVRVTVPGLNDFLCDLTPVRQYIEVPERGGSITVSLEGAIGMRQLKTIERYRSGGVTLNLDLTGHWVVADKHVPFWNALVDAEVSQSDWVQKLSGWGYRNVLLLEFDQPTTARTKDLEQAFTHLTEARDRFLEHDARHTVESLRQCLAAMVGKKPDDEDTESDMTDAQKLAWKETRTNGAPKVGYRRRFELTRLALKFTTDIAAHPEVDETTLAEAESLLIMTAGLLHQVSTRPTSN